MSKYIRFYKNGGWYFFTLNTWKRRKILIQADNINRLRNSFESVMKKYPFRIDAIVILPDHLHCIWQLPENDSDFSTRWRLVKHNFSIGFNTAISNQKEKHIWQKRFWEHLIRNEADWRRHMDYIHYNPVKHGYVKHPEDWEYGSYKKALEKGWYSKNWNWENKASFDDLELE